jgi:hypothetical protein
MEVAIEPGSLAERASDLNGRIVWVLEGGGGGGAADGVGTRNRLFAIWAELLAKQYDLSAIRHLGAANVASPFRHGLKIFEEIIEAGGVVINGGAVSGSTTAAAIHDAVYLENHAIPTVTAVHQDLGSAARAGAAMLGLAELYVILIPQEADKHNTAEPVARKVAADLYQQVIASLTRQ